MKSTNMLSPLFWQPFYNCVRPSIEHGSLFVCLSDISGVLSALVCQPNQKTLRCPPGDDIMIDTVFYGRTNQVVCNPGHKSFNNLNCIGGAKTNDTVHLYCDHQASCIVHADNSWLGVVDPCPGIPKYLQVNTYSDP